MARRPPKHILNAEILGVSELGPFLGYERSTVHVWGYRDQLPVPDYRSINGFSAWKRETIIAWAAATKRLARARWLAEEGAKFLPRKAKAS